MTISSGPVRDWATAVDLIRHSWKPGREATREYTPEFVATLLGYPGAGPVLAPAYYDDGALIAFVAGFPRSVRLEGQVRRLLLMSFFTVAPAYRGQGLGRAIWVECLQQAKDNGYDGAIHYCVDGNASNAITVGAAKSAGLEARRVFTAGFLMRSLRPGSDEQPEPEAIDAGLFRSAAECLNPGVTLTRLWSEAEAQWHLRHTGRLSIADQTGGVLTGVVQRAADAAHTPCFFLEDVLWDRLTPEARGTLLQRLLRRASRVASIAVAPALGYADVSPFLAAGFRRSPRLLHAYLTLWRAPPDSSEFSGLYLDIV